MTMKYEKPGFQQYPSLSVSTIKREMENQEYIILEDIPENTTETLILTEDGRLLKKANPVVQSPKKGTTTIVTSPRKLANIAPKNKTPIKICNHLN